MDETMAANSDYVDLPQYNAKNVVQQIPLFNQTADDLSNMMIETNNLQTTNPAIDTSTNSPPSMLLLKQIENQQQSDHVMTTTAAGGFD